MANRIQILNMASAFGAALGNDFVLGIGANENVTKINCQFVEMGKKIKSYRLAWQYLRYAKEHNITHIYCREEKLLFFMIFYHSIFPRGTSFSYELHHLNHASTWWGLFVFKRVGKIISITHGMKEVFEKLGIPKERILVAPDAVDTRVFAPGGDIQETRMALGLPLDRKIIMYTGNITEAWKGADLLCESAKLFDDSYLFVIVGGKPHHLAEFQETYPPRSNLIMVGQKSHKEIPQYLRAADVLILPNSNKEEISRVATSPMKLFEYMASGKPIVASDIASLREVLNEHNAVLFEPDISEKLAEGIKKVFENKEMADILAKQALRDVKDLTWEKRAKRILDFIK